MRTLTALLALALTACGESTTDLPEDLLAVASFDIVGGANQTDTIEARLAPITVELTAGASLQGDPVPGVTVNFVIVEDDCGEVFAGSATTDAAGRAAELWDLGTTAKKCTLEVRAVDADGTARVFASTKATVRPGNPVRLDLGPSPRTFYVDVGDNLSASGRDSHDNDAPISATWTVPPGFTLDGSLLGAADEAAGWAIATTPRLVDSVHVSALYDLRQAPKSWVHETLTVPLNGAVLSTYDCGLAGMDSTRAVRDLTLDTYFPGTANFSGTLQSTKWCADGRVLGPGPVSYGSWAFSHKPGKLGGMDLVGPYSYREDEVSGDAERMWTRTLRARS
jgi:hypothetical protein